MVCPCLLEPKRAILARRMPLTAFSSNNVANLDLEEGKAYFPFEPECMNLRHPFPVIVEIMTEWNTKGRSSLPLPDTLAASSILDQFN